MSPHYWDNTEPIVLCSQESFASPGPLYDNNSSLLDWDIQSRQESNVTAYETPLADAYDDDAMEDPLAYLNAYDSSYEEESVEYPQYMQNKEELYNGPKDTSPEMPEPEAEAEEDPYGQESDVPEYPNTTKYTEMPEDRIEDYDWPTTGMAGLTAEEYWNPEITRLEDNEPSSMMRDQMTLAEVTEWLQEPSDQVMFDRYDRPDREDNKKRQRLLLMELRSNYWTGDLGPDF